MAKIIQEPDPKPVKVSLPPKTVSMRTELKEIDGVDGVFLFGKQPSQNGEPTIMVVGKENGKLHRVLEKHVKLL